MDYIVLKEMATKNFNVSFQSNSKTIHIEVYYRILKSALFGEIFCFEIFSFPPSWIFVDMHDTSQLGSRNLFFLRHND